MILDYGWIHTDGVRVKKETLLLSTFEMMIQTQECFSEAYLHLSAEVNHVDAVRFFAGMYAEAILMSDTARPEARRVMTKRRMLDPYVQEGLVRRHLIVTDYDKLYREYDPPPPLSEVTGEFLLVLDYTGNMGRLRYVVQCHCLRTSIDGYPRFLKMVCASTPQTDMFSCTRVRYELPS